MRHIVRLTMVIVWLTSATASAYAEKVTFEEFANPDCCVPVPEEYSGLTWSNFFVTSSIAAPGSGYDAGVVSGTNVGYNGFGEPAMVGVADGLFTFSGAYFTAAWSNGLAVDVGGWKGSSQMFSNRLVLNTTAPIFFAPNWSGIDRLTFESSGGVDDDPSDGAGTHFAMDDFSYTRTAPAPVPEPASILLLTAGLAGLGAQRWRARRPA